MYSLVRLLFGILLLGIFALVIVPVGLLKQRLTDPLGLRKPMGWHSRAEMPPSDEFARRQF